METTLTWLVRYGHVLAGAVWVGGYAALALVLIPLLARERQPILTRLAETLVRVLTYTGTITIFFGILLITRTRGFGNLFGGEWGGIIIVCFILAVALLGIGDGALRPAIRRLDGGGEVGAARRWAIIGFALTILTIGLMTRALYART